MYKKLVGKKPRKTFIMFFVSYILILTIPVGVGSFTYYQVEDLMEQEAVESNDVILNQIAKTIDSGLAELNQLTIQLSNNYNILNFTYVNAPLNFNDRYEVTRILKNMASYKSTLKFIDDFYVYFPASNTILTTTAKWSIRPFYDNLYFCEDMKYDEWVRSILQGRYYKQYMCQNMISHDTSEHTEMLTFLQTVPINAQGRSYANVTVLINKNKLSSLLSNIGESNKRAIYILDNDNNIIASSDSAEEIGKIDEEFGENDDIVSYIPSQQSQWKYMIITPRDILMARLDNIKSKAISVIIIYLAIGIIVAYFMAYHNYSPIKKLISDLAVKTKRLIPVERDEYKFIEKTFDSICENNQQLERRLFDEMPVVKADFLRRILKDEIDDYNTITYSLNSYAIRFNGKRFVVMIFHIDSYSNFVLDNSKYKRESAKFIITNIAEELINRYGKGYTVDMDEDELAMIISFNDNSALSQILLDNIYNVAVEIQQFIQKNFSIFLSAFIGDIVQGICSINSSYKHAKKAMDFRMVSGDCLIIRYDDLEERRDIYFYPAEAEMQLFNCIKAGDDEKAIKILDNIFSENFNNRKISLELLKCLFFDMMSSAVKILNEIGLNYNDMFGKNINLIRRLLDCGTVDAMYERLKDIYIATCEYVNSHKQSRNEELKRRVLAVIDENYSDANLSLTFIAEHLEMNPSYLSHFFKEQIGYGIVDHINKIRIEHAKVLLKSGAPLSIIAQKVGYSSDAALVKAFRKYEGITPGQYRIMAKDI